MEKREALVYWLNGKRSQTRVGSSQFWFAGQKEASPYALSTSPKGQKALDLSLQREEIMEKPSLAWETCAEYQLANRESYDPTANLAGLYI